MSSKEHLAGMQLILLIDVDALGLRESRLLVMMKDGLMAGI